MTPKFIEGMAEFPCHELIFICLWALFQLPTVILHIYFSLLRSLYINPLRLNMIIFVALINNLIGINFILIVNSVNLMNSSRPLSRLSYHFCVLWRHAPSLSVNQILLQHLCLFDIEIFKKFLLLMEDISSFLANLYILPCHFIHV